ncbi:hypothetical protein [Thalassotalea sp. ND16A]|uniref:hypothetical protein n=1 Tax=Thalassotalea sp. ND16A TaxID=1535422 RepID=UPI000519F12D|nr:hypothetical protein [Thalassotalea sp. ND16A]KGJ99283.1 hypothetical protein ND16A_3804 [Thalassotalea sp. ND16A]
MSLFNRYPHKSNIWSAITIVAVLLFMPVAKSQHLLQHDSIAEELHCQVCLSSAIDDFVVSDDCQPQLQLQLFDSEFDSYASLDLELFTHFCARAPPVIFKR